MALDNTYYGKLLRESTTTVRNPGRPRVGVYVNQRLRRALVAAAQPGEGVSDVAHRALVGADVLTATVAGLWPSRNAAASSSALRTRSTSAARGVVSEREAMERGSTAGPDTLPTVPHNVRMGYG